MCKIYYQLHLRREVLKRNYTQRYCELIYNYQGDQFISRQINSKAVQGSCYFDNGNFKEANTVYEQVIEIYTNEVKPPRGALVRTLFNNGVALFNLEEYEKARQSIEGSIKINPLEFEVDSINLAYAYLNLSLIEEKLNQLDKAEDLLQKSLSICLKYFGQKHIEVFFIYRYLGRYFEKQDRFEKALVYYQMALKAAFKHFDDNILFQFS